MKINTHLHFHGLRIASQTPTGVTVNQALTKTCVFWDGCVFFATTVALLAVLLLCFWSH